MLPATQIVRSLVTKNVGVLSRAYGGGSGHHSVPSHNDLPVPQGDWQEHYQKTQARYNTQLAASVVLLGGIIAYIKQSGVVDFNFSRPDSFE